jgi:GH24 family phage-related lysozyme (muramidase)
MKYPKPSPNTLELLYEYEVGGGEKYYTKNLSKFTWPGGSSGPTIAIGVDCGYYSKQELSNIFNFLDQQQLSLVQEASGKIKKVGEEYTRVLRKANIIVDWKQAEKIFQELTWPKFANLAEQTFPGLTKFCPDAYGAIVSLVFNRGSSMKGDTRREMRNIRSLVPDKDYKKIAVELRSMKRIWEGQNLDGLLKRRDAEADLIQNC